MSKTTPATTAASSAAKTLRQGVGTFLLWVGARFTPIRRAFGDSPLTTGLSLAFLLLLGLLLVRPMVMSLMSYHRTDALFEERSVEVNSLRKRNARLEQTQDYYRTEAFVAERAREYGLIRPGETPFVIREYAHPESAGAYTKNKVQNLTFGGPSE